MSFHTRAKAFPVNVSLQVGVLGHLRRQNHIWPSQHWFPVSVLQRPREWNTCEAVRGGPPLVSSDCFLVLAGTFQRLPPGSNTFQHISLVPIRGSRGWSRVLGGPSRSLRRLTRHNHGPGHTNTPWTLSFPHEGSRDSFQQSQPTPEADGTRACAFVCFIISQL